MVAQQTASVMRTSSVPVAPDQLAPRFADAIDGALHTVTIGSAKNGLNLEPAQYFAENFHQPLTGIMIEGKGTAPKIGVPANEGKMGIIAGISPKSAPAGPTGLG